MKLYYLVIFLVYHDRDRDVTHIEITLYLSLSNLHSCCSHLEHRAFVKHFASLQFLNLRQSVRLLGRGISPSQGRYLHRTKRTQNKHRETYMHGVGFKPTIPVSERAKPFRALYRAATVISEITISC
jgi:hypothetical protein